MNIACVHVVRAILIAVLAAFSCLVSALDGNVIEHEVSIDSDVRTALIYKPKRADSHNLTPAVIALHGGLGNAENMQSTTGFDHLAELENFVTVYPNGTGLRFLKNRRTWNAGRCCGPAVKKSVDDVTYLSRLIDDLVLNYNVDPKKVYVTGFSNGAMMAYRLACEIPDKIAAIIPVSGTLAVEHCSRANSVAVLHIHGEIDENVPVAGGEGSRSVAGVKHRSIKSTMDMLLAHRGCGTPTVEESSVVSKSRYECREGADIQLLLIKNAGHVWPEEISPNKTVWDFARQFSKK
ncbi:MULTISPECIES: PHB depolymerase family esterase [unclassified Neptuniibacter]|uniref:alpha/beta hydrolase family esterase n=1 Tax=unclassified Neptuniibacter TaxID=2630693 RepID=UPI000C431CF3|nr:MULTISPECIES: PHB depolymerase family esterase [unclassified Neptuniibacter]MAY42480.1 phospholipase [Oceanospirillaceae bacterium]|tara:strand:- start:4462 stop:5340 length:879 start_codon:yes stop_codon:yes gene_type:complete